MDDSLTQPLSPSLAEHSPSQPPEQSVQATEQQLKARAEGVSIEVCSLPPSYLGIAARRYVRASRASDGLERDDAMANR